MKAGQVVFRDLLGGNIQYRVPLFQRTYSWGETNWQSLWDDLLEVYALKEPRDHFIGAVVTLPMPDSPEHATKYMLIDGQQRLTTLFILLAVVRDAAEAAGLSRLAAEIQEMSLINKFAARPDEREKLKPTQQDEAPFKAVIDGGPAPSSSRIEQARRFLRDVLAKGDLEGKTLDLERLRQCITAYLSLVSIRLEQDDSPHRIFESLNNKGMALTASDLIRNHIFMRIQFAKEQEQAYNQLWYPMQQRMEYDNGTSALSDFVWRYLMKDGELPRYDEVFEAMRKRIDSGPSSVMEVLGELNRYAQYYVRLSKPDNETVPTIRDQLKRLNQWEVEVAYPYLLTAMAQREKGIVDEAQLLAVLQMIESYVVRRIICGVPTNRLRRVFGRMASLVSDHDYVDSCRQYLLDNEWPEDAMFHQMFQTARIYIGARLSRTRLILTSLESSYAHHEPILMTDQITIEHVMPQTFNDAWRTALGSEANSVHERLLHTIGNLTYSGYNSEMGNAPFADKKKILGQSHFELNRWIVRQEHWRENEITIRARELADRALSIWKRGNVAQLHTVTNVQSTTAAPAHTVSFAATVRTKAPAAVGGESRYALLAEYLHTQPANVDELPLSFSAIEQIIDAPLPPSAHKHRAWWANDTVGHTHSQLWLDAGWRVSRVSLADKQIAFVRANERSRQYIAFWSALLRDLRADASQLPLRNPSPDGASWIWAAGLRVGDTQAVFLGFAFTRGAQFRVELYIDGGDQRENKLIFDTLSVQRSEIEAEIGEPLTWERLDDKRGSRIALCRSATIQSTADELTHVREWAIRKFMVFYGVFAPRFQHITLSPTAPDRAAGIS